MRAMQYLDPDHRLSLNFRVHEFCRSETAEREGIEIQVIDGSPVHKNLRALSHYTLQPVRTYIGALNLSSGYRPAHVNDLVGGVSNSQHTTGEAGDVWHDHLTPIQVAHAFIVARDLPFDQVILEHDQNIVHVSHSRSRNRREVMTRYRSESGQLIYVPGLVSRELCE